MKNLNKHAKEFYLYVADRILSMNGNTTDYFFDYSGHINCCHIRCYKGGYSKYKQSINFYDAHYSLDKIKSKKGKDNIIKEFEKWIEETSVYKNPYNTDNIDWVLIQISLMGRGGNSGFKVRTKADYDELMKILGYHNFKWDNHERPTDGNRYACHQENTCILIDDNSLKLRSIEYCIDRDIKLLTFTKDGGIK